MTRTRRRRLILVACLMLGLSGAAALGLFAFRKNMVYFYTPSDIAAGHVPVDVRFRMGGLVERGSVQRSRSLTVTFRLADCQSNVPVTFRGTLPDLFRPGQGVIAYGKLDAAGAFVADRILAKHDANYMSAETAKALKTEQSVSCMPTNIRAGT